MTERQEQLLFSIIEEHIKSANPIGSKLLEAKGEFDLSSATIRNEMMSLEEGGYIEQPYTSAGRVPTAKGYRYYLDKIMNQPIPDLSSSEVKFLNQARVMAGSDNQEVVVKSLAKAVAEISQATVFLGLSVNNFYYTGLTYLLSQPEFTDIARVCSLAKVVDHLDGFINQVFNQVNETKIYLANEAPLSDDCGLIISPFKIYNQSGLLGILGPLRMDYRKNLSLLNTIKNFN